jgi:hypothetical protein
MNAEASARQLKRNASSVNSSVPFGNLPRTALSVCDGNPPVLRSKPAELAEAVGHRDVGDARFLAGGEQLLAGARQPCPSHPAERRRPEIKLEMRFQRARPHAGDGGKGVELDRLVQPAVEPIEREHEACGQSVARGRRQAAAAVRNVPLHSHGLVPSSTHRVGASRTRTLRGSCADSARSCGGCIAAPRRARQDVSRRRDAGSLPILQGECHIDRLGPGPSLPPFPSCPRAIYNENWPSPGVYPVTSMSTKSLIECEQGHTRMGSDEI